jgi:hypothetical protein
MNKSEQEVWEAHGAELVAAHITAQQERRQERWGNLKPRLRRLAIGAAIVYALLFGRNAVVQLHAHLRPLPRRTARA